MEVFKFLEKSNIPKDSALCLGNFDGVHLGHRRLFDAAKNYGVWGVMVFEEGFKNETVLTTLSEKLDLIKNLGADYVITVKPTEEFLNIEGDRFYQILAETYNVGMLVAGYDFRFGKGAKYSSCDLACWCKRDDIKVHIEDEFIKDESPVKSTLIRELILAGSVEKANELLGRVYSVSGIVEKGLGNGRKMGFPTANVSYPKNKLLPSDGVYKGMIYWRGDCYDALINIGKNPTFDAEKRTVEVHIPNLSQDMYSQDLKVEFIKRIRGEIRFSSVEELIDQIKMDINLVIQE